MVHTAHRQAPENNDRARREMCQRGGLSSIAGFIGTDLRKADKLLTTNFRFCCNFLLRCMRIQFEAMDSTTDDRTEGNKSFSLVFWKPKMPFTVRSG